MFTVLYILTVLYVFTVLYMFTDYMFTDYICLLIIYVYGVIRVY